jgi:hypothetical protein
MRIRVTQKLPVTFTFDIPKSLAAKVGKYDTDQPAGAPPENLDETIPLDFLFPRFPSSEWEAWANELDNAREERAVGNGRLNAHEAAKFLLLYPVEPTTRADITRYIATPSGGRRIFRTCAKLGNIPGGVVEYVLANITEPDLETVVRILAAIVSDRELSESLLELQQQQEQQEASGKPAPLREEDKSPLSGSSAE